MVMAKENVFEGVDWNVAPEWANYWTWDDLSAQWWEGRPSYDVLDGVGAWWIGGNSRIAPGFCFSLQDIDPEDSLVERPSVEKASPAIEPTEDASWIWCNGTKNSGACFATEADAARDAVKHSYSSDTFYVAQVTRVIKPFKRSATA